MAKSRYGKNAVSQVKLKRKPREVEAKAEHLLQLAASLSTAISSSLSVLSLMQFCRFYHLMHSGGILNLIN